MLPQPPSSILASSMAGHDCGSPPLENLSTCYLSKQRTPQLEAPVSDCGVCSRRWVFSLKDFSNCMDKVLVVSYNILGVENASNHPDLYSNIPHSFLEWDRRKRLILEEINNYNASILCFQEVDHFNDLDDLFQNSGFKGVYKARTGEAQDGCAVFWKDKLFKLLHQEDIEFQRFGMRNNVAQLCVFEANHDKKESDACNLTTMTPSTGKRRFVVGNIHVLFNPNRGDIKLGQVRLLLDKAYKLSQEWGNIPVIIAGDLNSVPQSAIYKFLSSSKLDIQLHDRRNMSGQLEIQTNRVFRSQIGDDARETIEQEMILGSPWQHHTTPSSWELLIISGILRILFQLEFLKPCPLILLEDLEDSLVRNGEVTT
uniref:Endonuclease/exonuclease/phosphatase domain-containing protein n=1 Tax=Glycine max TaxID=3847 RepID=A0A0R0IDW2_SOYBN